MQYVNTALRVKLKGWRNNAQYNNEMEIIIIVLFKSKGLLTSIAIERLSRPKRSRPYARGDRGGLDWKIVQIVEIGFLINV